MAHSPTGALHHSRSHADLGDKTLIKAKPVTNNNRVLGAPRVCRGRATALRLGMLASERPDSRRSHRRRRLSGQPPCGLPDYARWPRACPRGTGRSVAIGHYCPACTSPKLQPGSKPASAARVRSLLSGMAASCGRSGLSSAGCAELSQHERRW